MYQYDSRDKAQPEKANTHTTNKDSPNTKFPVQTKSLFSFPANLENSGGKLNSEYTPHSVQPKPIMTYSPLQMQLMPKQEQRGISPLPMIRSEEQERLAPNFAKPNNTGLPLQMKEKFENLSGFSSDDVKVHYNSDKPAKLQALAYTQGNQVYVGPGQVMHLAHELGHVVQQMNGYVKPTAYVNGVAINDDPRLEAEADRIGGTLSAMSDSRIFAGRSISGGEVVQGVFINNVAKSGLGVGTLSYVKIPMQRADNDARVQYPAKKHTKNIQANPVPTTLSDVSKEIVRMGNIAIANEIAKKLAAGTDQATVNAGADIPSVAGKIMPFFERIKFGNAGGGEVEAEDRWVDVLFANSAYGYTIGMHNVTHGEVDVGTAYMKTGAKDQPLIEPDGPGQPRIDDYYPTAHNGSQIPEAKNADDITKVISEGARWVAVRDLAASGHLNDDSKFFAKTDRAGNNYAKIVNVPHVVFSTLWNCWSNVFLRQWGITNDILRGALNASIPGRAACAENAFLKSLINAKVDSANAGAIFQSIKGYIDGENQITKAIRDEIIAEFTADLKGQDLMDRATNITKAVADANAEVGVAGGFGLGGDVGRVDNRINLQTNDGNSGV